MLARWVGLLMILESVLIDSGEHALNYGGHAAGSFVIPVRALNYGGHAAGS